jgi:hypothetical protein
MTSNTLAKKEDIINCLISRQNGLNIQQANQYISEIEVNHIFIIPKLIILFHIFRKIL